MNPILSKEDFAKCISSLKKIDDFHNGLDSLFKKYDVDGFFYPPDCSETVMFILRKLFQDSDDLIKCYVSDLHFGKSWREGALVDENGQDLPLRNPDDLYDLLCKKGVNQSSVPMD